MGRFGQFWKPVNGSFALRVGHLSNLIDGPKTDTTVVQKFLFLHYLGSLPYDILYTSQTPLDRGHWNGTGSWVHSLSA